MRAAYRDIASIPAPSRSVDELSSVAMMLTGPIASHRQPVRDADRASSRAWIVARIAIPRSRLRVPELSGADRSRSRQRRIFTPEHALPLVGRNRFDFCGECRVGGRIHRMDAMDTCVLSISVILLA
jgi:hypothetical protein